MELRPDCGVQPNESVTACAGAYFLGLRWMHRWKSGFLLGVGEDAAHLAERMDAAA